MSNDTEGTLKATKSYYDAHATEWAKRHAHRDFWKDEYSIFADVVHQGRVLDLGCGTGRDSFFLSSHGYEYVGGDYSHSMLSHARVGAPGLMFVQMDMRNLCFPPNTFDAFWACASLLHIPKDQVLCVLKRLRDILKPVSNGFISLKEGTGEGADNTGRHFSYYQTSEFKSLLGAAGFVLLIQDRKLPKPPNEVSTWLTFHVTS